MARRPTQWRAIDIARRLREAVSAAVFSRRLLLLLHAWRLLLQLKMYVGKRKRQVVDVPLCMFQCMRAGPICSWSLLESGSNG